MTNRSNVEYYEDEKVIIYGNWDYLNFKLFALSVLWRASISKNHLFRDVDIGTNEEIIRNMILNIIPGKFDLYPILMVAITSCNKQTAFDLVTNPDLINVYGRWAYRFVFGGFVWLFLFGDTSNFPMRRLFFQPEGTIIIPKREMDDINFLVEFSFELYRQGKLALSLDSLKQ